MFRPPSWLGRCLKLKMEHRCPTQSDHGLLALLSHPALFPIPCSSVLPGCVGGSDRWSRTADGPDAAIEGPWTNPNVSDVRPPCWTGFRSSGRVDSLQPHEFAPRNRLRASCVCADPVRASRAAGVRDLCLGQPRPSFRMLAGRPWAALAVEKCPSRFEMGGPPPSQPWALMSVPIPLSGM